ncbi:MAG: hypothetical protein GX347_00745 [Epulopiscium sp.]|nr:hypothetical protein [Candidatus Epulonipiscium sp.]
MKKLKNILLGIFMILVLILLIANNVGFNFLEWGKSKIETSNKENHSENHSEYPVEKYLSITIQDRTIILNEKEMTIDEFKDEITKYNPNELNIKLITEEAKRVTYQEVIQILKDNHFIFTEE